ncbi:hypothetical protein RN001_004737 [Aquatica leii]|uniref:Cytochrome P450 n=1 Tax=Aquatica leii TaxID=1421715 RepID=A0AAN7QJS8_9COLE|nr:hypothetical protein RN001_004737 [Aquatica leii]
MILLLPIFVFVLIFFYLKYKNRYWYYKGVKTPQPKIIFGNVYDIITNKIRLGDYYDRLYKEYKSNGFEYIGFYTFTTPVLIMIDPELIKLILQTDFQHFCDRIHYVNKKTDAINSHLFKLKGAQWKNLRIKLTPTFTSSKMKFMFNTVLDCSKGLLNVANKLAENNELINIHNVVLRYTSDVIASCAFGVDSNSLENPNSMFVKCAEMIIEQERMMERKEYFSQSFPKIADLIKLKFIRPEVKRFFNDIVSQIINNRETNNIHRQDFMDLLIQLKNKTMPLNENNTTEFENNNTYLTVDEIVAQVFLFFSAGYETSSATLTFCFYELALNTVIQDKLRSEIRDTLAEYDGKITYEALSKMTYMDMIIKETLRKYPPLLSINRKCVKTYKVPNRDLVIDKDTNIVIPVYSIHTDQDYYPNPKVFDPERFSSQVPSCTWLAFGDGPRNCIGLRFGLLQVKLALTSLILKYKFTVDSSIPLSLGSAGILLTLEEDIFLNIKKCT